MAARAYAYACLRLGHPTFSRHQRGPIRWLAPYGKRPNPNLLYGLVYTVAAVGALLWLLVLRGVPSRGRSAPVLAVVVTTITAALALLLPVSTEYGAQIFPPLWGILAVLPPAAGILAVVLLFRRRHALA